MKIAEGIQAVADASTTERTVSNRSILGDFNFPPTDEGFGRLKDIPGMVFLIVPPAKTTITDTRLYDNFWFQQQYVREYVGECGVERFDETMFGGDDRAASKTVSDHRPIWAKFNTKGPDDD